MNISSSINANIISVILLFFIIRQAKRNIVINKYKTHIFVWAAKLNIALLVLESVIVVLQDKTGVALSVVAYIVHSLMFILIPILPFVVLFFNYTNANGIRFYHKVPIILNSAIVLSNYFTKLSFTLDAANHRNRGPLFFFTTACAAYYFVMIAYTFIKLNRVYDRQDKIYIFSILCMISMATIIQIILPDLIVMWASIAVGLVLYYIFLRELQYKYDPLTNVKNRVTFEKDMAKRQNAKTNTAIVMLDINNFKTVNDEEGHMAGDYTIKKAAAAIKQAFLSVGDVYRIGGDEFCIICKNADDMIINKSLNLIEPILNEDENDNVIRIAKGYSIYDPKANINIYSVFSKADSNMYENKMEVKKQLIKQ